MSGGRRARRTDGCRPVAARRAHGRSRATARSPAQLPGTARAGTFAGTADQSRSLAGGRRACCQWQVRGCLQHGAVGAGASRYVTTCTGRRVRAGWGESQGVSPAGHPAQKGPLTAMQIRLTVLAAAQRPDPAPRPATCSSPPPPARRSPRWPPPRRGRRRAGAASRGSEWRRPGRAVRRTRAARRPAVRAGRATADRRRGAVPPGPRRADEAPRDDAVTGAAPRGRGPRRGRRPSAARRADPDRPLRRRRRPARRPRCLPAALRGDGRRGRPGLGRRPRLHERHVAGRHAGRTTARSGSRRARCCGIGESTLRLRRAERDGLAGHGAGRRGPSAGGAGSGRRRRGRELPGSGVGVGVGVGEVEVGAGRVRLRSCVQRGDLARLRVRRGRRACVREWVTGRGR